MTISEGDPPERLSALWFRIGMDPKYAHLRSEGTRLVPGAGDPQAQLMLIGEAPGGTENRLGLPFVGRAGQLLDGLLAEVGLRRQDLWITNVLKYRPPGNRTPYTYEVDYARRHLFEEIELVNPERILLLGNTAVTAFSPFVRPSRVRGQWVIHKTGRELLATYHPAAVLRDRELLADVQQHFLMFKTGPN